VKRLFIGLELPESCKKVLVQLDPRIKGVRWLDTPQIHLTMSFLGDVDAMREERLRTELAGVEVPPFFLPVQGVGVFGGSRPTVLWAGVGKGHPHLFALHKHIQDAVLRTGLEPDLRPFHPHITIARMNGVSRAALTPFLRKYAETEFALWKVTGFALFSSVLSRNGATHSIEMRSETGKRGTRNWERGE
jgi:2'-5' RNA ligase